MKLILLLFITLLSYSAIAQSLPKAVDSRVIKVAVFPEGAQVTRSGHCSVPGGTSELVFGGISPDADPSSIQVEGSGAFTILSVSSQPNKLKEQKKRKEIEDIERSKEGFDKQLIQQKAMLDVYTTEEQMLEANKKIGGNNVGLKAADLTAALDLHRTRLRELKFFEIDYNQKIKKIQDTLNIINAQINSLNNNADISTTDLIVTVLAKEAVNGDFTLNYVVKNAGWFPSYDLHVDDISKPLLLHYKANVYQNTGEEWKDIKVTFSNGNPNESGVAPELTPLYLRNWTINRFKAAAPRRLDDIQSSDNNIMLEQSISSEDIKNTSPSAKYISGNSNINYSTQTRNATAINFELATPYTVINDGQNHKVDMKQEEIPATFEYFCVPKKEKKVYLVAHVINWLDYNLMDGEVNLYYEGTYTGKTAFNLANTEDTLNLSLGHDKGITVNRTQVKDFSKHQIFSDKKSASTAYDIAIRNNKTFSINITIEDQIPISTDKEITVENTSYEGAQLDEATGKITWKLNLEPAKEKKVKLSYTIKYPKSYRIQID
jgi:uncharacterized protein (TIGR02231 family)